MAGTAIGETLWHNMRLLLERVVTAADREAFLDECLDTLVEHLGAERALVMQAAAGTSTVVLAARGPGGELSAEEQEEISRTIVKDVLAGGECVVWRASERGTTESMATLTIMVAMAAPLTPERRGVLYADFRDVLTEIGEPQIEFFRGAAAVVAIVLELSQRLERAREDLRVARAREGAEGLATLEELLWSPSLADVRREIEAILPGDGPVLIVGESGTGKTALARAIAEESGRKPIVRATLGASDDLNTITSELFGHERGAFSGAVTRRVGLVELAHGGTLILDEVLSLPRHAQALLLDFTQFGTYRPLGHAGAEPKRARARIIAATNGDLDAAVKSGAFRLDLYYRLAATVVRLPPLRARRADIPGLAESFLSRSDPEREWRLSLPVRRLLVGDDLAWPGNVRQLEALIARARARALARNAAATELRPEHFDAADLGVTALPAAEEPAAERPAPSLAADLPARWDQLRGERERLEAVERELIRAALARHSGVVSRAARELSVPRTTLVSRLRALGIH